MIKYLFAVLISCSCMLALHAQDFPLNEAQFDSLYALRIQQEEINGVYIPVDLQDAFAELQRLSSATDLEKFRLAPEDTIRHKLHFGLGRWIIVNWAFYEGSRLSHFLKEKGLETPDDMARVLIVCFHRQLNQLPLHFEEEVAFYKQLHDQERAEREKTKQVILEETRTRKKEE